MMANDTTGVFHFNAWKDKWLPLIRDDGATEWASPVELLAGEKDGVDLDYPRDDFRIYARLLLSALVQALFAPNNKAELITRMERPLDRQELEQRISPVEADFDLFGESPFLQVKRVAESTRGAASFAFPTQDLFRPPEPIDAVSLPVALVALFVEQAFAGGGGRGYGAGPAGQLGALTLIDPGSVRLAAWANTLAQEYAAPRYTADGPRPWSNAKRPAAPRQAIGLVEGLFFQPRAMWLEPAGHGVCSFSGAVGELVRFSPLLQKSELTKKATKGQDDLWQHPCSPLELKSQGIGVVRLNAKRPSWTGLAQLLEPLSKVPKRKHPREGPALVLQQWRTLARKDKRPRLMVLDFDRDKANVKKRFFEAFPLTELLLHDRDSIERLRALSSDAQEIRTALVKALVAARGGQRRDGFSLADADAAFWSASEGPFVRWLDGIVSGGAEQETERASEAMHRELRAVALRIFDAHVSLSEFDLRKQKSVAKARLGLAQKLHSRHVIHPQSAVTKES